MLNLFKDKIKFVSEYPKIQNNKIILDDIQNLFNYLIKHENFFVPKEGGLNKCTGSIDSYHGLIGQDLKKSLNVSYLPDKKFKVINCAVIKKETKRFRHRKYNIRMILGVTWRQEYSYDFFANIGEPYIVKDYIHLQKEVPRPQFLFSFRFYENLMVENGKVIDYRRKKEHIQMNNGTGWDPGEHFEINNLFFEEHSYKVRNLIRDFNYGLNKEKKLDQYVIPKPIIYELNEIKTLYKEFIESCSSILKKHSINFEDVFKIK